MKRGFTLTEVLIAAIILSIMVIAIFEFLRISDLNWHEDAGLLDLQREVRQSIDGMLREVRQARPQDISITAGGAQVQFIIPTDITTNPVTYSRPIIYKLNNNQIIREHPAGTSKVLANYISSLTFCCLHGSTCDTDCSNANILQIRVRATTSVRQRVIVFPLAGPLIEEVRLRNASG